MFTCKIENTRNEIIELTQNESNYQVVGITGLNPPNAQINSSTVVGMDGSKFNSSKLEDRNIVITLRLNGDVEANRIKLYSFFRTKEWCKFYYKNGMRNVYIEGYVETVAVNMFAKSETMQISILCPNPYFKAMDLIIDDISKIIEEFEFPFAINVGEPIPFSEIDLVKITNVRNDSESESGLIISAEFLGNVSKLEIKNTSTGKSFTLNYDFVENDRLRINTNSGEKSVTLIRDSVEYNLIPYMKKGSTFFQLDIGDNFFSFLTNDGTNDDLVHLMFEHRTIYRGV